MNAAHNKHTFWGWLLVAAGALFLAYIGVWLSGAIQWSFDTGVQFLLGCGVVLVLVGAALLHGGPIAWLKRHKGILWTLIVCAGLFVLSFAVTEGMVLSDAWRDDSAVEAEFVLVPGATVVAGRPSLSLQHRLDRALTYLRAHPSAVAVVSGGQGDNETSTEASVMKQYLVDKGLSAARVVMEDKSENTVQNVAYSKKIIDAMAPGRTPKVMIITSDFHMHRAMMIARAQGMDAYGTAVRLHWGVAPIAYCREYFSMVKLLFTGLTLG